MHVFCIFLLNTNFIIIFFFFVFFFVVLLIVDELVVGKQKVIDGRVRNSCVFRLVTSNRFLSASSKLLSTERITTVFSFTMACISLNRVCFRVLQDKLYQLLVNKNQNTIYQQSRKHFNNLSETIIQSKRNNFKDIGFNSIGRNLTGSSQVNFEKIVNRNSKRKREEKQFEWKFYLSNHQYIHLQYQQFNYFKNHSLKDIKTLEIIWRL